MISHDTQGGHNLPEDVGVEAGLGFKGWRQGIPLRPVCPFYPMFQGSRTGPVTLVQVASEPCISRPCPEGGRPGVCLNCMHATIEEATCCFWAKELA